MRTIRTIALTLALSVGPSLAGAAPPPANSPLSRGEHPRVFFTATDLPGLRDRIAALYKSEFQAFVNLLNDTSVLSSGQKLTENNWGAVNYAFLAALDPREMQLRGFSFAPALDTPEEYCARAIASARALLGAIASGSGGGDPESLSKGFPAPIYLPATVAYDWCFPYLSAADRTAIVDAFVSVYNLHYAGKNILTMSFPGAPDMVASSRVSADIHDLLGVLAFYGDPYPSAAVQAELYDAFHTVWVNRVLVELNYFYRTATGWHEGPGGYLSNAYVNFAVALAAFSSAAGSNYVASTPFFTSYPLFQLANVGPHGLLFRCGSSGTSRCPEYLDRWGTISGGIAGIECKSSILTAGLLRHAGHANAPLAKWAYQQTAGGCPTALTVFGGTWANAVVFMFIYGDKEVTAQSPVEARLPKTHRLGLGQYVMRTGYESTDSRVVFWAPEHAMYGHATKDYGHFTIHKFGNLILKPANSKSGDAEIKSSKFNLMGSMVGIHKGASDATLDFNGNVIDPFFGARGSTTIRTAGRVIAEDINRTGYDYVAYDNSPSWSPTTADVFEREFVYLKGPLNAEYVVVLDRVNVRNPGSDEKIWKIWIPADPQFVNGTPTNPRLGKWTSVNTDTMVMTNRFSSLTTPNFSSAPTHGRFFLRTLSPSAVEINVLGGPGKEYQSGDDDGSTPWGAPAMTQGMHEYLGWGRIEVRPRVAQAYDVFLNVIQFGDADTLALMTPTVRVDSADGRMIGVDIRERTGNRVVMFSASPAGAGRISSVAYTMVPVATASRQLLVNMNPSTTYHVKTLATAAGTSVEVTTTAQPGSVAVTSDAAGVLDFTLNGLSVDATAPAPPKNLMVR